MVQVRAVANATQSPYGASTSAAARLWGQMRRTSATITEPMAKFSANGKLSGTTGCNDFHGPSTLQGSKIHIGPLSATKKDCLSQDASDQEAG